MAEEEKVEFTINHETHLLDYLDPTKEGVIFAGQTITTSIWLLNTLFDYLELKGRVVTMQILNLRWRWPMTTT